MAPTDTTQPVRMTPLAALLNTLTTAIKGQSLGTYLAIARIPGPAWKSYDALANELTGLLNGVRTMNRVSVKTMSDGYGIPDTRYVEGRSMPRPVTPEAVTKYLKLLRDAARPGVDYDRVAAEVAVAAHPADTDAPAEG